jgi:DNA polymerase elongation subunit (family B)
MNSRVGWILDVYVEGSEAIIWLKTTDNQAIKLRDRYQASLYVLPKTTEDGERLLFLLRDEPSIAYAGWELKYTTLRDRRRRRVLHIVCDDTSAYRRLVRSLEESDCVEELFNTDLLHVQQYLFTRLGIEPTSKVHVTFDEDGSLISMDRIDDDMEVPPPPFTALYFDIHTSSQALTPDPNRDPIASIEVRFQDQEGVIEGDELSIIMKFSEIVRSRDPDFLVCPQCDEFTFPYLFTRSKLLGLNPQLGREPVDINSIRKPLPYWVRGRVALDYNQFGYTFDDWGIAGLVERARFSFLPPGIAGRWTSNRVNDSRCCYELMKRGYVIPRNTGYYEYIRPMGEIIVRDKGGMIISPKIGLVHENVAELDFESQYPQIIVKECISYETVTPHGVKRKRDALLPYITKRFLDRRLYFKGLGRSFPKDSLEWTWCEQRQSALKLILVTLYGTSGCCWNRFGNVLAFEEINKKSREAMVKTKDFVQQRGFEVIYADCDSIFVKKPGATREDYERLAREISDHIGLPIALDHHYKFLILLPLEADPSGVMEAQKRYFGILYDGEIIARGIEVRRHDTPKFIKDFQVKLIKTLFDCENAEEVQTIGYDRALQVVTEALEDLMKNRVPPEDLVVSKILRKPVSQYKSVFPHVSAAIQLIGRGRDVKPGETVDFIYTDADHHNPLCRVIAYDFVGEKVNPDREKYRDMVLDAAETVLSTFGFTREVYGLKRVDKRWWRELLDERRRETILEAETEEWI